jgi:hexokinase
MAGDEKDSGDDSPTMGSTALLPQALGRELKELEQLFRVSKEKLKLVTQRFQEELKEGLKANGKNIPMNITWVKGWPTGGEKGSYLTVDLGGTNVRACWITLSKRYGETKVHQHQYKLPDNIKTSDADTLWDFVAESVENFIKDQGLKADEKNRISLGFTFSYPATQDRLDHGVLQTWTKGLDIKGVEGEDVAEQFQRAMNKRDIPVKLVALVNDTTGAMIASSYNDDKTIIGAIFGTGCNAAYMEDSGSIPKVSGQSDDTPMAINCEYGAFDNSNRVLPRTKYDKTIDEKSPRPGEQTFEKMSAGLYLGEIYRLVMVDLHGKGVIFKDQDIARLHEAYAIDTGFLSATENDESDKLSDTKQMFQNDLSINPTDAELQFLRRLAEIIAVRGARLCACGIAAICRKKEISKGHVAADGSVANKHPNFKKRWAQALGEILDWPEDKKEDPISLTSAEDGSGIGAAVIVAMALEKGWV